MRNVTILLAVVAMFAATAQAALVDEDFSSDPGWTKSMGTGSDFGYDVDTAKQPANAITGYWAANIQTSRYYTTAGGSIAMNKDSSFTASFDITPTRYDALGNALSLLVGLMDKDSTKNVDNFFGIWVYQSSSTRVRLRVLSQNATDGQLVQTVFENNLSDMVGTLFHCELEYDGAGTVTSRIWADGTARPDSGNGYYSGGGWDGSWTVNAFGTANWDAAGYRGMDATVDDMYLVPEPATMVLLGLGGIGVLIRRRKK